MAFFKWLSAHAKRTVFYRLLGLVLLIGFVLVRLVDPLPLEILRLKAFDLYQQAAPAPQESDHQVLLVDIDEESLAEHGQWPWARSKVAELVAGIARNGGVALGFDMIFAEPDRLSPEKFARSLPALDAATRARLQTLPDNDETLASAMNQLPVVLGQSGFHRALPLSERAPAAALPLATIGADPSPWIYDFPGVVRNIEVLEKAAAGLGFVTIIPERDGVVRRIPVILRSGRQIRASLAVELLRIATGGEALAIKSNDTGVTDIAVAGVGIPSDRNGRVWIRFSRHDRTRYVPARDVLANAPPARRLAGKLVIIGTSATGLHDLKSTPMSPVIPGAEIHAQLLESILKGQLLQRPSYALGGELILAITSGAAIILLVPMLGAMTVLGLGVLVALGLCGVSYYLFVNHGYVFDVAYPLLSSLIIFAVLVFLNYLREELQRRQIRSAFGQYLSPALVEQLARDPQRLVLGGETRTLSLMFSDVRGFTSISESYRNNPQGLTQLINRLLTPLSEIIMKKTGTIDKYMGDNIMAFWNAPLDVPDHAQRACEAALAMLQKLQEMNVERRREDDAAGRAHLPLNMGIGINTGSCVVGNIGSDTRFDYSVLGDSVNLASRLEGQTKSYGLDLIIGEKTAELVEDKFALLPVDRIRVKGKDEPVAIHTIVGDGEMRASDAFRALKQAHLRLLAAYLKQDWRAAKDALKTCRQMAGAFGLSGLYDVYEARIRGFAKTPPPSDWDGVYRAESK